MLLSLPSSWSLETHYLPYNPVPLNSFLPYKYNMLSQLFIPVARPLFGVVCSVTQLWSTLWDPMDATQQVSLSSTISQSLLRFMSIESMVPSNHLISCHPLLLLPSIFPSIIMLSNESALNIRWPKYWGFRISPSNEYSVLIAFSIYWLDLLVAQKTLKSLIQYHTLKA